VIPAKTGKVQELLTRCKRKISEGITSKIRMYVTFLIHSVRFLIRVHVIISSNQTILPKYYIRLCNKKCILFKTSVHRVFCHCNGKWQIGSVDFSQQISEKDI